MEVSCKHASYLFLIHIFLTENKAILLQNPSASGQHHEIIMTLHASTYNPLKFGHFPHSL